VASHEILGGLVQVYKRMGKHWHCSASIEGKQRRTRAVPFAVGSYAVGRSFLSS
jgi:hypothetical protein